ncbi:oligosaccharide flippase family protein [Knoellia sp. 3-2P3]|uniref:lipopolysaccharide biosynthesis protein n=1 Tax=unclassified Knoellia TaxID=2618719 RepID=UPI0023DB6215|nr:oligosaccharide flippase family protein [Knoellia sp. 3-2P3]MDF2094125.1 oligosaccharide flippase family protein [Knoellia sp. 3-2P3]
MAAISALAREKWTSRSRVTRRRFPSTGEYGRNILTLLTGTTIAQAIPIAAAPVLTRLYSPQDFGIWALFVSITVILGTIANGRYDLAIMLPQDHDDAVNVAALGVIIAGGLAAALLVVVAVFSDTIATLLSSTAIRPWLFLVPAVVLLTGVFNSLNYLNNRAKNYKLIATANVYKALSVSVAQIGLGLIGVGASGLVGGQALSSAAANGKLLHGAGGLRAVLRPVSRARMAVLASRYRKFPQFSLPSALANVLANHLTSLLIAVFFSASTLGFYAMVQRILGIPSFVVGNAVGQVYFQQAAAEKARTGQAIRSFQRTVLRLFIVAVPMFGLLYYAAPPVFAFALGESWSVAGHYAQILTPLFAARFVVGSVTTTNSIFERQGVSLAWQIGLLMISVGTVVAASDAGWSFELFLWVYSLLTAAHYVVLFFVMRRIVRGPA